MGEINKDPLQKVLAGPLRFLTRLTSPGATGDPKHPPTSPARLILPHAITRTSWFVPCSFILINVALGILLLRLEPKAKRNKPPPQINHAAVTPPPPIRRVKSPFAR